MTCLRCLINEHTACYEYDYTAGQCCDNGETHVDYYSKGAVADVLSDAAEEFDSNTPSLKWTKPIASLKDPQSTGRKQAAVLYPLNREAVCEWQGLAKAGGGKYPIAGCLVSEDRKQTHRHHGPDKNTLNNEKGNVHRICAFCHNRWHAANDPHYNPNDIHHSHDAQTLATAEDAILVKYQEAVTPEVPDDEMVVE